MQRAPPGALLAPHEGTFCPAERDALHTTERVARRVQERPIALEQHEQNRLRRLIIATGSVLLLPRDGRLLHEPTLAETSPPMASHLQGPDPGLEPELKMQN